MRPLLFLATAALLLTIPAGVAEHTNSGWRSETVCASIDICIQLTINIGSFGCAWQPLGTPCTGFIEGSIRGSGLPSGSASGSLTDVPNVGCNWTLTSCSVEFQERQFPTYRGAFACATGEARAESLLEEVEVRFYHCYEMH